MTHQEYWNWLFEQWEGVQLYFSGEPESLQVAVFVKSLPPYDKWLENKAISGSTRSSPDQESPAEKGIRGETALPREPAEHASVSPSSAGDSPNFAEEAQNIRSMLRTRIKAHKGMYQEFMSQEAFYGLGDLIRDWAQGCRSWWIGLDSIPDSELVNWNVKHEVFV